MEGDVHMHDFIKDAAAASVLFAFAATVAIWAQALQQM
ncbi:hypothetical protein N177_2007 [Lutibaculum baratangense AMV1]|uniref:Uncharacterized protein n=1 Tax=Lutibaculum baratangense AMV1 TaxID=631454 RepID=V4TG85_9HYPH|nr:hypothetical protein N177_2007 [Lutibaculum baratangense AMV1]